MLMGVKKEKRQCLLDIFFNTKFNKNVSCAMASCIYSNIQLFVKEFQIFIWFPLYESYDDLFHYRSHTYINTAEK